MQHISYIALFLLLAFGSSGLRAQDTTLSLSQILGEIDRNNPGLQAYESTARSQDAKVAGAGAWMAPMIGAGIYMAPYPGAAKMDPQEKGSWMFSAEQEIPNPARLKAKAKYLQAQSAITRHEQLAGRNLLHARAKELYFTLLIASKRLKYEEENLRILATMKKLAEIRYPYNQGTLSQVFKAKGRLHQSENNLLMTQSSIRSTRIALNTLMNRPAGSAWAADSTTKLRVEVVPRLDTAYLAENRSDIKRMESTLHAMDLNLNLMRQQAKPDFRIRFEHMSNRTQMMPSQYTLMGMVSIPIAPWSARMYRSELRSMTLEQQAMRKQKEAMLTDMLGMARSIEGELPAMEQQLVNFESKILGALKKNMQVSMLAYQQNKGDLTTVLDAWEALNMAQMNYLDQLQKYYTLIIDYEKTIEKQPDTYSPAAVRLQPAP